jgi:hypothetical protein
MFNRHQHKASISVPRDGQGFARGCMHGGLQPAEPIDN